MIIVRNEWDESREFLICEAWLFLRWTCSKHTWYTRAKSRIRTIAWPRIRQRIRIIFLHKDVTSCWLSNIDIYTYIHVFLNNVYLPHYKDLLHYILFIFMVLSEKWFFILRKYFIRSNLTLKCARDQVKLTNFRFFLLKLTSTFGKILVFVQIFISLEIRF